MSNDEPNGAYEFHFEGLYEPKPKFLIKTLAERRLPMYCRAISASARGSMLDFSVALFYEIENVNLINIFFFNLKRDMKL